MELSPHDQALLDRTVRVLQTKQSIPFLTNQEVSQEDVNELISSPIPDLSAIGLHVLSLIRKDPSRREPTPGFFEEDDTRAHNYARWIMTERPTVSFEEFKLQGWSRIASNWEVMSKNVPPSPIVAPAVTSVNELTVIVHGTWASSETWWQPNGDFWRFVDNVYKSKHRGNQLYAGQYPYRWSGADHHNARVQAAKEFRDWLQRNPHNHLDVIAHSHGGNVCFLATRLGVKIRKLVTLGTPIRLEYLPDLRNVGELYNVFSTTDYVQMPAGTIPNCRGEGRTLGDSTNVFNYRADNDGHGHNPGHSDLHDAGTWNACSLIDLL